MFVNLNETFELLEADSRKEDRSTRGDRYSSIHESASPSHSYVDPSRDNASKNNRFSEYPKGILIEDSYNNPFFPITPTPRIDNGNFNLKVLYKTFRTLYGKMNSLYLPWHYTIGFMKTEYFIFNTRPIDLKFPKTTTEIKQLDNWDGITKLFFKEKIFNVEDAIHICIIGDSNTDVYTKNLYKLIGTSCISPMMNYFKMGGLYSNVFGLNLGSRFNISVLEQYMKR